jgi:hypothetical protein
MTHADFFPFDHYYVVATGVNPAWSASVNSRDVERQARRLRRLHQQMPIAFPLPISVWACRRLERDGMKKKRIHGPWERACRCDDCLTPNSSGER